MNPAIVRRLILKDWYIQRNPLLGCVFGGLAAIALMWMGQESAVFAGSILLITAMIVGGVQVAMQGIVNERKDQTMTFIMSLPVSPRDYTASKLIGGAILLVGPWLILLVGTIVVISISPTLPDGLIPYSVIVLTELLASSFVLLAVALVSESPAWTIGAMMFGNLFINGFLYYLAHLPGFQREMKGPVAVWSDTTLALLAVEFAVIAITVGLALYFQDRKTDFL